MASGDCCCTVGWSAFVIHWNHTCPYSDNLHYDFNVFYAPDWSFSERGLAVAVGSQSPTLRWMVVISTSAFPYEIDQTVNFFHPELAFNHSCCLPFWTPPYLNNEAEHSVTITDKNDGQNYAGDNKSGKKIQLRNKMQKNKKNKQTVSILSEGKQMAGSYSHTSEIIASWSLCNTLITTVCSLIEGLTKARPASFRAARSQPHPRTACLLLRQTYRRSVAALGESLSAIVN